MSRSAPSAPFRASPRIPSRVPLSSRGVVGNLSSKIPLVDQDFGDQRSYRVSGISTHSASRSAPRASSFTMPPSGVIPMYSAQAQRSRQPRGPQRGRHSSRYKPGENTKDHLKEPRGTHDGQPDTGRHTQLSPVALRAIERRKKRLADQAASEHSIYQDPSVGIYDLLANVSVGGSHSGAESESGSITRVRTRVRFAKTAKNIHEPLRRRFIVIPRKFIARVPFITIIGFIALCGLSVTLWLSSQSARGTYELAKLESKNKVLHNRADELEREMAEANSSPVIAARARKLGMVPASQINVLIYRDKKWKVHGIEVPNKRPPYIPSYHRPQRHRRAPLVPKNPLAGIDQPNALMPNVERPVTIPDYSAGNNVSGEGSGHI